MDRSLIPDLFQIDGNDTFRFSTDKHPMKRLCILFICAGVAGCIPVPVYKTLQPAATMKVSDAEGNPVPGAEATFVAYAYPYGFEKSRDSHETDSRGIATFASRKEWRVEAPFVMHGSEVFFWNWCVRKQGYKTYLTSRNSERRFEARATVVLERGDSEECPQHWR